YVRAGTWTEPVTHAEERRRIREAATEKVRAALHRGRGRVAFATRWLAFSIVCAALRRLVALRDECRHVTTMMGAHLRRVALEIDRRAVRDGTLAAHGDVFFLTWGELPRILSERGFDWRRVSRGRRRERERNEQVEAPDLLAGDSARPAALELSDAA